MAFWQLSGPGSHLRRDWKKGKRGGNTELAEGIFDALCTGRGDGIELILGIQKTGASQILLPYASRDLCRYLNWGNGTAHPGSNYTALSPIKIDTHTRLCALLEERQHVSKATKASKMKGDNSKANGKFWNGPPNSDRAAFEHGRLFWRILSNDLQPQTYGLPEATWLANITIFSLALNYWAPTSSQLTQRLIDASLTEFSIQSIQNGEAVVDPTWYFVIKENRGLWNSSRAKDAVISEAWDTTTISQSEIGPFLSNLFKLKSDASARSGSDPLVLLVHDYATVQQQLAVLGLETSEWALGLTDLLGFPALSRQNTKREPDFLPSRARSHSPRRHTPGALPPRKRWSPSPQRSYAPVYVVDIVTMFKTATGSGEHLRRMRPVTIKSALTGQPESDTWCAGRDSNYVLQSWKEMVQGSCVEEQRAFFEAHACPTSWASQSNPSEANGIDIEAPEADGLFQAQRGNGGGAFNNSSDSDEEWY